MNDTKYIGLDVHQATISAAVLDFMILPSDCGNVSKPRVNEEI